MISWRWGSLVECLRALRRRKGALELYWDPAKFHEGRTEDQAQAESKSRSKALRAVEASGTGRTWSKGDTEKFTRIIRSTFFWCYAESWQTVGGAESLKFQLS